MCSHDADTRAPPSSLIVVVRLPALSKNGSSMSVKLSASSRKSFIALPMATWAQARSTRRARYASMSLTPGEARDAIDDSFPIGFASAQRARTAASTARSLSRSTKAKLGSTSLLSSEENARIRACSSASAGSPHLT